MPGFYRIFNLKGFDQKILIFDQHLLFMKYGLVVEKGSNCRGVRRSSEQIEFFTLFDESPV